jgi:hypothetical protein
MHRALGNFASVPRAAATIAASAVLTGVIAYYVPKVLSSAEHPPPALTADVLDNTEPPLKMVVPQARTGASSPGAGCDSFRSWAVKIGGIDAGMTTFKLVVQANDTKPIYIAGLRAVVVSSSDPASGIVVSCPSQEGAVERSVVIDLDKSKNGEYIRSGRAQPFDFVLHQGETEIFHVKARTSRHSLRWFLQVDAVVGGRHELLLVKDSGRPFATTGYAVAAGTYVWNGADAWTVSGQPHGGQVIPVSRQLTPLGAAGAS